MTGLNESRYVVTCNGQALPMQSTGTTGEYVAGVRYKAWNPPSALHPTIGVHAPLTFDIVDTWMKRSLGGCQYYVAHPGGLNYDTFPVNSYEAESRRMSRFCRMGHTPGVMNGCPAAPPLARPAARSFRSRWTCGARGGGERNLRMQAAESNGLFFTVQRWAYSDTVKESNESSPAVARPASTGAGGSESPGFRGKSRARQATGILTSCVDLHHQNPNLLQIQ